MGQGNRELQRFIQDIAMQRQHPDVPAWTVAQAWQDEKPHLLALPTPPPTLETVLPAIADKTAFVRFDTNLYSVPPAYAAMALSVAADDAVVRLLDKDDEIARHVRCWGKRQTCQLPVHREQLLAQRRHVDESLGYQRLRTVAPGIERLFERWMHAGRNAGSMTTQTLKLLDLYDDVIFVAAVRELLTSPLHDPGALALLCEKHRRHLQKPLIDTGQLPHHARDRHVVQHALEDYDV